MFPTSSTIAQPFGRCLPIVLVGGQSSRFGRNKLLEPLAEPRTSGDAPESFMVDRPIAALRAIFGPRVTLVGPCDVAVAARADAHLADPADGQGPLSGILAALRAIALSARSGQTEVFVLAGDLPNIDAAAVATILAAAERSPSAFAILGHSGRLEPCIGLYRLGALAPLAARLASGRRALHDALDPTTIEVVALDPKVCLNINHTSDLRAHLPQSPE